MKKAKITLLFVPLALFLLMGVAAVTRVPVPLTSIATQAASTIVANITTGSAAPTAQTTPAACSGGTPVSGGFTLSGGAFSNNCQAASGGSGYKFETVNVTPVTVTNSTTTETDLQTFTLAANELGSGQVLRITVYGTWTNDGMESLNLGVYFGSAKVSTYNIIPQSGSLTNNVWEATYLITPSATFGSSVTSECDGNALFVATSTALYEAGPSGAGATGTCTIATNATAVIKLTAKWGSMSGTRSVTSRQMLVERLN